MNKIKKEWVKDWNIEEIVNSAVSLGMEFMAKKDILKEELQYNEKILIKEIKRRIK